MQVAVCAGSSSVANSMTTSWLPSAVESATFTVAVPGAPSSVAAVTLSSVMPLTDGEVIWAEVIRLSASVADTLADPAVALSTVNESGQVAAGTAGAPSAAKVWPLFAALGVWAAGACQVKSP